MEAGAIQSRPDAVITPDQSSALPQTDQNQHNNSVVSPKEDSKELSSDSISISLNQTNTNAAEDNTQAISSLEQAREVISQLSLTIQQNPSLAGSAQNNLTSSVVKSLLG